MDRINGGMFANLVPQAPYPFPDDSQCPECKFFDTSRQDVMNLLIEWYVKTKRAPTVEQARCKCKLPFWLQPMVQGNLRQPYSDD